MVYGVIIKEDGNDYVYTIKDINIIVVDIDTNDVSCVVEFDITLDGEFIRPHQIQIPMDSEIIVDGEFDIAYLYEQL